MLDWLKKQFTLKPAPTVAKPDLKARFRQALAHYPAHVPPHRGWGRQLTPEQAQQNLDWFKQTLPERLAALRALAGETGLTLSGAPVQSLDEAEDLVARLIYWTRACWPDEPYRREHLHDYDYWAMSDRTGDDAIFSMVLDVATLLGETIRTGRSEWRWGLDMDPSSLGSQPTFSARRVVLISPLLGERRISTLMDMESLVVSRYRNPRSFHYQGSMEYDSWMVHVRDGYTGREIDLIDGKRA
ncbi:MAG: hypothetical protein Q4G71_09895 [Pseudomonadota bacterium]|nr:hypothetical protein [Pseudomonadota bacterium]